MGAAASAQQTGLATSRSAPSTSHFQRPSSVSFIRRVSTGILTSIPSYGKNKGLKKEDSGSDGESLESATHEELIQKIKELERLNEANTLELKLIYSLDDIRDDSEDPAKMFSAILALMVTEFRATLSILYLFDRESEELELWAQHPRDATNIEKRIRHPASLFSFVEENSKPQVRDGTQDVKIGLLDVFPPHFIHNSKLPPLTPTSTSDTSNNSVHSSHTSDPPKHIAIISIMMHGKQMGMLVVGRNLPFTDLDIRLLKAAESQIDSAVVQAHNNIDFMLSNKELEVIYRVDRIRDENHGLEDLVECAVKELDDVIMADVTFVMLYKVLEAKLALQAASRKWLWSSNYTSYLESLGKEALDATKLIWNNTDDPSETDSSGLEGNEKVNAAMCVPLILQNQIIGVFGALNTTTKTPFLLAHRRLLKAIASQMDNAIYDSLETFRLRQVLGRSVDGKVLEKLLLNPNVEVLKPERTVCTVLFADIRGSTHLAERTPADLLGKFINAFLSTMSQVIIQYEGTLDKFIGDEVMAIFNIPFPQKDHALRAITVGFAMQEAHASLMKKWEESGITPPTPIGVGVATGELIAGEYGCSLRTDYTVIGRAVNLGARITSLAQGGSVLCSEETYLQVRNDVEAFPVIADFKGIGQVTVYHIKSIKHPCAPMNNSALT